jgi:hypothetical protein
MKSRGSRTSGERFLTNSWRDYLIVWRILGRDCMHIDSILEFLLEISRFCGFKLLFL